MFGCLSQPLAEAGFALPGSVVVRSYLCAKAECAYHAELPRLDGPYIPWSQIVAGRTLDRHLGEEELGDPHALFAASQAQSTRCEERGILAVHRRGRRSLVGTVQTRRSVLNAWFGISAEKRESPPHYTKGMASDVIQIMPWTCR